MSPNPVVAAPISAGRRPELVVARLTAVKAGRSAVLWGLVFGLFVATSALAYAATYQTPLARAQVAATFGTNIGLAAVLGRAHQISTVGGFTAWRSLGVLSIVGGVWGLLTGTRLLRGEEDSGRWELLLAGPTTRRRATVNALVGLGFGLLILWSVIAVITIAVGRADIVDIGVRPALFLALALVAGPAIFLAVGALASQLAPTRRQAAGYGAAVLGVSYGLRMISDSKASLSWLRWVSPLGWVLELRPLTSARLALLLPITALIVVMSVLTSLLAGSRDLGASLIADRPRARARTTLLSGPTRLAVRLTRGGVIGWGISIAVGASMMGLAAKSAGESLAQDPGDRNAFVKLGFRGSGAEQYLTITFLMIALAVALAAAGQVGAIRAEEASGRLEHLLVRPLSRNGWLAGRLAMATGYVVLAGLIAGISCWFGAASQHAGVGLWALLGAGLNVIPPAVLLLGIGTLTFGVRPRAVAAVMYGVLVWSFLVEILGGTVNIPGWILDTSLFHQMAASPAVGPDWVSGTLITALGVAAAGVGAMAFGARDLTGD